MTENTEENLLGLAVSSATSETDQSNFPISHSKVNSEHKMFDWKPILKK